MNGRKVFFSKDCFNNREYEEAAAKTEFCFFFSLEPIVFQKTYLRATSHDENLSRFERKPGGRARIPKAFDPIYHGLPGWRSWHCSEVLDGTNASQGRLFDRSSERERLAVLVLTFLVP